MQVVTVDQVRRAQEERDELYARLHDDLITGTEYLQTRYNRAERKLIRLQLRLDVQRRT